MIRIEVVRQDGVLRRLSSRGHADTGGRPESAPCAAVSVVLKSFGLATVDAEGCTVEGAVPEPGVFDLSVMEIGDHRWYAGVSGIVERQIAVIAETWPDEVTIDYRDEEK